MNPFDEFYDGNPPWEIGRPQPAVEELVTAGAFSGDVLDVGCGTGENALLLASRGHTVCALDAAHKAIASAKRKARARRLPVRFLEHDALELHELERQFDTILDSGLFHVFADAGRIEYVASLEAVARPGTTLHVLCFSEDEPDWGGPRRVSQDELRAAFAKRWVLEKIDAVRFANRLSPDGAKAWRASFIYTGVNTVGRA